MQFEWLNRKENSDLIVFFNGWGMNSSSIQHLIKDNFDIIMFFDYRKLDEIDSFENYKNKYLVAWSMGVYAANFYKKVFDSFNKKIAINGTNCIVSNKFGIPEKMYKITLNYLNSENLEKFKNNMFAFGTLNPEVTITRDINELKEELISIQNLKISDEIKFDKVIISNDDRIIPTKNQINFWQNKVDYEIINSTHCPFKMYRAWHEILC